MILQQRYDSVINYIEEFVKAEEADIPLAIAKTTGLNLRLLGDAFQFIADITLAKYIRQRRLVNALKHRNEFNLSIEQVVSLAGFSDAAAFSKACKNTFGYPPTQITDNILSKYPPLSFDYITSDKNTLSENNSMESFNEIKTICGISAEQFETIKHILDIGAIYGLDDEEAEFVYRLSETCKITVDQAAEFHEDFKLQLENESVIFVPNIFDMAEFACKYNLSFSQTQSIFYELSCNGFSNVTTLPEEFFDIYFCEENNRYGWNVHFIYDMVESLLENNLSPDDIQDIVSMAETFCVDIIDAIENYHEYQHSWDIEIENAKNMSIFDEDYSFFYPYDNNCGF